MDCLARRPLNCKVREVIPEHFKCVPPHYPAHCELVYMTHVFPKVPTSRCREGASSCSLGAYQSFKLHKQRQSGKSSLIKAVFKVNVTVCSHTNVIQRDRMMKTWLN